MGTFNGFYVRGRNASATAAIQRVFPNAEIESSAEFLGVRMGEEDFVPPEPDLGRLSAALKTDVIWLGFQSAVDAFQFHLWRDGNHVRALVYGFFEEERTWERVEGTAEPWEREIFFSQEELNRSLRFANGDAHREELRRIWREAEISTGKIEPSLDSRDCAHTIARYYQLPHYGG